MMDAWIEKFSKQALPLIREAFNPKRVLLFGSRVTGHAREESDLDVILVSEKFEDIPFVKRMAAIRRKVRFPKHVDYLCYTPEEFERVKTTSSIIMDAMEHYRELV